MAINNNFKSRSCSNFSYICCILALLASTPCFCLWPLERITKVVYNMNTVMRDKQPRVSFLHCEELHALTNKKKGFIFGVLFFVSSSLDLSRRTFSARGGGGRGVRTHRTPPAYAPSLFVETKRYCLPKVPHEQRTCPF